MKKKKRKEFFWIVQIRIFFWGEFTLFHQLFHWILTRSREQKVGPNVRKYINRALSSYPTMQKQTSLTTQHKSKNRVRLLYPCYSLPIIIRRVITTISPPYYLSLSTQKTLNFFIFFKLIKFNMCNPKPSSPSSIFLCSKKTVFMNPNKTHDLHHPGDHDQDELHRWPTPSEVNSLFKI